MAADDASLEALGRYALRFVKPGHTIGLGTGRAASAFIRALGASGIAVRGVPTSKASEELGRSVGIPIVTLADLDHVWLRAYLNESDLGRVAWGQPAVVTTDTWPGKRYQGRISFISSEAEFTPKSVETHAERVTLVYRIKIDVENPRHELKPGMPADALIDLSWADHRPLGLQNGQPALH